MSRNADERLGAAAHPGGTTAAIMGMLVNRAHASDQRFGNLAVIGFLLVQYLDGFYTYAGFAIWGLNIEANPLIRSAVAAVGPGAGLAAAKLLAIGFGMLLHLRGVHMAVALLTGVYVVLSIVPWTALLFLS